MKLPVHFYRFVFNYLDKRVGSAVCVILKFYIIILSLIL